MKTKPLTRDEKNELKKLISAYCGLEVFYSRRKDQANYTSFWDSETNKPMGSGYYFWFCCPGYLPDSDPFGPYRSKTEALREAVDMFGDSYDVDIATGDSTTEQNP